MALLEGYQLLDLSDLKGQFCGKLLRDLGMEVIKVEPPGGDPVRLIAPFKDDRPDPEGSIRFAYLNAGKKSVTLDLSQPEGQRALLDLAETVDVVLESFAPGDLQAMGLGQDLLRQRNPGLIVTSISGFGQEGPYAHYLCPDIVGFAMGGLMYISGDAALPPLKGPETQSFYYASVFGALGTLLALWRRKQDGLGRSVDISIQEGIGSQEHLIQAYGLYKHSIKRHGSLHENVAPARVFPTRDGYVYLFVSRQHWKPFLKAWPDHPSELDEPTLELNRPRRKQGAMIDALVTGFTTRFTNAELEALMAQHGIPCLPVNSPLQFMNDAHVRFREVFEPTEHPVLGQYEQISCPVLIDGQRREVAPPPLLGQHTDEVLAARGASRPAEAPSPRAGRPAGNGGILQGLRVLTFTAGVAGPTAGRLLAQCGAEVIKIESRDGGLDSFRYFASDDDLNASPRFIEANLNVLSAQLNLKTPRGLELVKELVAKSDVVLDNFRADVLPRLGLSPEVLQSIRPDLIVIKMPGFGSAGPRSRMGTWGSTLTAFSGVTYLWNHPGQPEPIGYQGVFPDYLCAALAPTVIMAALLRRQRTGQGAVLDLAQSEATAYMLGVNFLDASVNQREPQPVGNEWPTAAPHNCYPCVGDDRWCVIAVETDEQWARLCEVIGRHELAHDERYATLAARRERLAEIDAMIAAWTAQRDHYAITHELQAAGVPAGAVQSGEELSDDPQLRARDFVIAVDHPTLGHMPMAGVPLRLSDGGVLPPRLSPMLGEHNDYVICDLLGYSREQLAAWEAEGVVR